MSLQRTLRTWYIRTTNVTHGYQGMEERLVALYRAWSKIYDVSVAVDPAYRRELKALIDRVVSPGDRVLDLGAGTGLGTLHAAARGADVVAIDLSPEMIARLRRKARRARARTIETIRGSFPRDLASEYRFDAVISSFAVVHWSPASRRQLYCDISGRLREGGRLGLFSAQGEVAPAFETRAELESNLARAGFTDVEMVEIADIYRAITARKREGGAG
jgi:SAM-dependent methyltransferase